MDARGAQRVWSPGRRAKLALFLAGFSFFLLTGSRERPFSDATPIWEVAESIVRRASLSIRTVWPPELPRGQGGRVYAVAPLLQSLVHVPGAWGRWALGKVAPASAPHSMPFFSHLAPAALGGLLCLTFWLLVGRLVGPLAAALSTGTLALGTYVWVYARSPYSEILQAACFLLFFLALLRARSEPTRRSALLLGAAAGALLASKLVYAVAIAGGMSWLAYLSIRRGPLVVRDLARFFGWVALAAAPFVLLVLVYNYVRWGSWLEAGYGLAAGAGGTRPAMFGEQPVIGLWGMFLSPGKSLFLYCPPLLVGALALPRLYRRAPELVAAMALTALPVVLVYSRFLFWAGDYAWGPRYLVFLAPLLMVPAAVLLGDLLGPSHAHAQASQPPSGPGSVARGWSRRLQLGLLAVVAALGIGVQVLGISFIWDHHIRLTRDAADAWLGKPNKTGASAPEREGLCGACFEDMHRQQWLPAFHPIHGHLWLLRHVSRGHDWPTAVKDAPWSRYTTLTFDLSAAYQRIRLDWWFLELRLVSLPVAIGLLLLLLAGTALSLRALLVHGRRGTPAVAGTATDLSPGPPV
jgi:hypothetical protein